jgi:GAF domain-containing protein
MDAIDRETRIISAFVDLAHSLTTDFDEVALLHALVHDCVELLDMNAGAILLADGSGELHLTTSTSEAAEFVEVMQLAGSSGPCIDCFNTGNAVAVHDIADDASPWPLFQVAALAQGFHSALATPMKLRGKVIGTLNLFSEHAGHVSEPNATVVQALADVGTIGIVQERVIREARMVEEQLHRALDSRIIIEQAKGVIASSLSLNMDQAFELLRKYSRDRNLTIRAVSQRVTELALAPKEMATSAPDLPDLPVLPAD